MGKLDGKVALITGAGRQKGIGRATALRLAAEGADVAVSALPRDPASFPEHERSAGWHGVASVAREIEALGRRAIAIDCDVTKPDQVEAMIARVKTTLGRLDIVVNNAGVPGGAGSAPIVDLDDAVWRHTIDVNLNGVYYVSKHAARAMLEAGEGGAIVNLASLAARFGIANYGGYSASKFAVIGLTQQMAQELAPLGIRVNAVCPGVTETDMMLGTYARQAASAGIEVGRVQGGTRKAIPMKRPGVPEDQAATIAFLCGPDAAFITGQSINVDGGFRMD
ncbi:SDR family NAD(P)-dependent oxidoreductase [Aminobacter sp. LjRoot7]|uniref:SDR family NAD(P)-dependent oxidoreductase n=1 Tax=Aminobacter sp. LjRoot7 TaxID=3342335 RepID=UPI003ED0560D